MHAILLFSSSSFHDHRGNSIHSAPASAAVPTPQPTHYMRTAWTCSNCTYRHEAKESDYLTCAICVAPRSTINVCRPEKTRPSTSVSSFTGAGDGAATGRKRQGNLLDHFGSNQPPKKAARKRQRNTTTTTSASTSTSRSLLDALKPCRASSFAPRARYRDHAKDEWKEIPKDADVAQLCPMTVVRDVLPSSLAAALLNQLERESTTWNRGNWIVHGQQHVIPRTTATYNLTNASKENEEDDEYLDQKRSPSPELRQAADCVSLLVREHCPWTATVGHPSHWQPTFAFANRYENGKECVGWHADHLTPLGPRPIIVGLSLGACRRFDLRQMPTKDVTNTSSVKCRHVSVPLPHNSVCIMWNDAQESWQHSVPRCSDPIPHPTVGPVRISLTFRKRRQLPNFGNCHCGHPAGLKAKDGKYYLFCRPYGKDKNKTCLYWNPCLWAEEEAKRLIGCESGAAPPAET